MTATSAPPCRRTEARPPDVTNTRRPAASHHPARRRPSATTDQFCACADPCNEIEIRFQLVDHARPPPRLGSRPRGRILAGGRACPVRHPSIHPSAPRHSLSLSLSLARTARRRRARHRVPMSVPWPLQLRTAERTCSTVCSPLATGRPPWLR
jgi:hypothetical protein